MESLNGIACPRIETVSDARQQWIEDHSELIWRKQLFFRTAGKTDKNPYSTSSMIFDLKATSGQYAILWKKLKSSQSGVFVASCYKSRLLLLLAVTGKKCLPSHVRYFGIGKWSIATLLARRER
jgi:hypothetical protein